MGLRVGDRVKRVDGQRFGMIGNMAVITKVITFMNGDCIYEINNFKGEFYTDKSVNLDYPKVRFVMDKYLQSVRQPWMYDENK